MSGFDPRGLALRVEGLIRGPFGGNVDAAAHSLAVDPVELRRIVEGATEAPEVEILERLVIRFGVCASWLVTGAYDWRTHRSALEDEAEGRDLTRFLLRRALRGPMA